MTDAREGTDARPGAGRRGRSFADQRERRAQIDDPTVVLEAAARFLEPRARSVAEVRRRLIGAGYRADLVEAAIGRMRELGVLDDEAFARAWVESRDRARPRGERAIRSELARLGVDREVVDARLAERREGAGASDPGHGGATSVDEAAAQRLLGSHLRSLTRVGDPRQRRQRAYALLARNGFDAEVCRAVSAGLDQTDEPTGDG